LILNNDTKRKLICFVIPYFGHFPNTMSVFLQTIKTNPNYSWLLFTDDYTRYDYPDNVIVKYCSFSELTERIQKCFDFKIALYKPYKLCDFKPAYGYIFKEELKDFDYWGHCDMDQFFGSLSNWLTKEYLQNYDRIFGLGHMTIYRNCQYINTLFMNKDTRENLVFCSYKQVFQCPENQAFDEMLPNKVNINYLAKQAGIRQSNDFFALDIAPFKSVFIESLFYPGDLRYDTLSNPSDFIILWDEGNLYKVEEKNGEVIKTEALYAHLQKRKLVLKSDIEFSSFVIVPNQMIFNTTAFSDEKLKRYIKRMKKRSLFRIDELQHWMKNRKALYKHRIRKAKTMILK